MIRVAHVIPTLDRAGSETQLARIAPALDRTRFETAIYCLRREGPLAEPIRGTGIPLHLIGQRHKISWRALFRLRRELSIFDPHVLHTWLFTSHFYGRLAGICAGVPVLVIGERCVDLWKTPFHWMIDRALAHRTDAIVANAGATLDFLRTKGVTAPVMRVIPNALDPGLAPFPFPSRTTFLDWDFLAAGRLHEQKDYPTLLAAFAEVRKARPGATLAIAGEGPERTRLESLAARLGLSGSVTFLGLRADVPKLMAWTRCFVMSSIYEGSSNSLLEALAAGVPVVTTGAGGSAELVPDGCGIIVPVKDPRKLAEGMLWTMDHPEEARSRAARASGIVRERHALASVVRQHEALYTELLAAKGIPA